MAFGLQVFNASGALLWDSSVVAGGVIADVRSYTASGTATLTYPTFAGRSVKIMPLVPVFADGGIGVSADTSLGYPRVTVVAAAAARRFMVLVY